MVLPRPERGAMNVSYCTHLHDEQRITKRATPTYPFHRQDNHPPFWEVDPGGSVQVLANSSTFHRREMSSLPK